MSEGFTTRARLWRYLGYAAGAVLVLALVVALGSWLAVRVWGPELARERLEAALTAALERPTRVERVSVQPWLGRVVIGDVTVAARPGEPGPHFVKLGRLEINLGLSSLWRRRLGLPSVRPGGGGPRVDAGGRGGPSRIPGSPRATPAWPPPGELAAV